MALVQGTSGPGRRRALLIGVPRTPYLDEVPELAAKYPPLAAAERDVSMLRGVLRDSGYAPDDVEAITKLEKTGQNPVLGEVSRFFGSCAPGDTAFLYFSCHGEAINGRDHLVLADAQPDYPLPGGAVALDPGTLLPAEPGHLLRRLPQGVTAIVCLDICRTADPEAPQENAEHGTVSVHHDAYWVYSCGSGQRSYADPVEGSWFARALADALSPLTPPRTLHDVVEHTQDELARTAETQRGIEPPEVRVRVPRPVRDEQLRDPVICAGSEQVSEWTRAIRESPLWKSTSGTDGTHRRVQDRLADLVRCVVGSGAGSGALRDDPWHDPDYPVRVAARLADLVGRAALRGEERLSPAETACLLAAAVVHQGIVAITLDELRTVLPKPDRFDPGPRGRHTERDPHRRQVIDAARDVCRAHSLVLRTAETLRARGRDDAAKAADHWLRHRFVADWDRPWFRVPPEYRPVDELIDLTVRAVTASAGASADAACTAADRQQIDHQLRQVLGHLTVKPGNSPRINPQEHGEEWITDWPMPGNQWRGPDLARLLWTAALLAADPRRLSSVLVDHLGAHDPLVAGDVAGALRGFGYDARERPDGTHEMTVRFRCPHPALHAALEELALTADAAVRSFREDPARPALLRGLPVHVTTDQLRAVPDRYKEPLERFRLAEDEIRPLLMGTQLYGDRMLAVRELYQNALDACRYRDMRRQYGKARSPWEGEIVFTQGRHDGRPYIECGDNGSGMTRTRLTSMFARAGKRYEQDPDFVQERRNWRRAGITDQSMNSRFGIGVFSYFMLADEVVVWTRPVDRYGIPATEALRADIQSGSGLLQINATRDPEAPERGGTRVRLYLAEATGEEKRASALDTLRALLWVTEHRVSVREVGEDGTSKEFAWKPGVLAKREGWYGAPLPLGSEGDTDAWLVQGEGQLLLDGVVIKDAPQLFGQVVNLRERHAPVPSVNRDQLLSYDEELVEQEVLDRVPDAVVACTDVSLHWLWELSRLAPRVAVTVLNALPEQALARTDVQDWRRLSRGHVPLAVVGCLPLDEDDNTFEFGRRRAKESLILKRWRKTRLGVRHMEDDFAPPGYPDPGGLDALLFQQTLLPESWYSLLHAAAQGQRPVREILRALRRYAITGVHVPATADIRAWEGFEVSQAEADLCGAYTSLDQFLGALGSEDKGPWSSWEDALWTRNPPARHAPLLGVAALHELSLGETAELLSRLHARIPSAVPGPPPLPLPLARSRPSLDDAGLLVSDGLRHRTTWFHHRDWHAGGFGPVALLTRAAPPYSNDELAERVRTLAPLGFSLSAAVPTSFPPDTALTAEQRLVLSFDGGRREPWFEGDMDILHVMRIAEQAEVSLKEAAQRIDTTHPTSKVSAPPVPPPAADWQVPPWVLDAMDTRGSKHVGAPILLTDLVICANNADSAHELPEALAALDACGQIDWTGVDRDPGQRLPPLSRLTLPSRYKGARADFTQPGAALLYLLMAACLSGEKLGLTADELTAADTVLPLSAVRIPAPARDLRLSYADLNVLQNSRWGLSRAQRFKEHLTISDLLSHAESSRCLLGETVRRLAAFAGLGAPALPGSSPQTLPEELDAFAPDVFDHAAFDAGLLGPGVLGPLELVLVAGRFGWTLGRTYDRYAPFLALGLDVTVRAPDPSERALVPDWQDVIVLTEQLTGRAPAVRGAVPRNHLALCAEETDLGEDGVRARLTRYARLFGLTLPAGDPTPPTDDDPATEPPV
ncbi:caspase family protein [Streptomyces sp. NPDC088785]|uniref:HD domain-containing protein n=1 Tax=Streptomyces sp. NPDC088785 TaxID=3365897 RepID=UPI003811BE31